MKFSYFRPHLHAELRVEIGKWFVKEEYGRISYDGAPHCDPLALTAGQVARSPVQIFRKTEDFSGGGYPGLDFALRRSSNLQGKRHVGFNSLVWVKGIGLEDHCNIAL